jgi:4-carboxymuconolactone decarboxylase
MQRMPFPDPSQLPSSMQKTLQQVPLNVVRMCAHASPLLFAAQGQLGRAVATPEVLEPRLRETVILRVAYLSGSHYELHHHIPLGRAAGLTEAELNAIGDRDYSKLPPLFAAAARFTDEVVRQLSPADETLDALRALSSDQMVVNIVLTIGCYMSLARLAAVTGIEQDKHTLNFLPSKLEDGAA